MSYAGLTTAQLTPELLQQMQALQDQQRQQNLAKALMSSQADPKTAYAGLANVGSDLSGAYALNAMQRRNVPTAQGGMTDPMDVSMGGISRQIPGQNIGPISGATPNLGTSIFGKMFGMGG